MKGMDVLCTSQAATAIRMITTTDEPSLASPSSSSSSSPSSSISSTTHLMTSGRAIDRHNPIIRDEKRVGKSFITPPCSNPQHPISPKPYITQYHYKKSITTPSSSSSGNSMTTKTKKAIMSSSSGIYNKSKTTSTTTEQQQQKRKLGGQGGGGRGWGCTKASAFISPPSSSRYLLSDKALLNVLNDFDPILTLVPQKENSKAAAALQQAVKRDHHHESFSAASTSSASKPIPPPSSSSSRCSPDQQVVVLRVSLHCRGCERKMRKHISKMEGVTSFNIDFAAKKLTVVGDVTPLSVLASVSKVKNATLLTPTTISSTPAAPIPAPDATSNLVAEVEKYQAIVV